MDSTNTPQPAAAIESPDTALDAVPQRVVYQFMTRMTRSQKEQFQENCEAAREKHGISANSYALVQLGLMSLEEAISYHQVIGIKGRPLTKSHESSAQSSSSGGSVPCNA